MPDIVERLRMYARQFEDQHAPQNLTTGMREAAAEIERLRGNIRARLADHINGTPCAEIRWMQERETLEAEIERLRAALKEYVCDCPQYPCQYFPCGQMARAALTSTPAPSEKGRRDD